jgi:hypothetical protein
LAIADLPETRGAFRTRQILLVLSVSFCNHHKIKPTPKLFPGAIKAHHDVMRNDFYQQRMSTVGYSQASKEPLREPVEAEINGVGSLLSLNL